MEEIALGQSIQCYLVIINNVSERHTSHYQP